ncbi:hypothetical protein [Cumulibacter soli]|uniref:hypothetical protein n=1 Tax=Cumulibacter soli TaxID=2546344 RepID=UPI001068789D|nr:hypothetical protein [Cumulibacter soli]
MSRTKPDDRLPARMRDHDLEAELRESPDLHKLAQVFIGLAMNRAREDHTPAACQGREVEPEPQDADD